MPRAIPPGQEGLGVRVVLIDEHELVLAGLSSFIQGEPGFTIVGQAGNQTDALPMVARTKPDVIMFDINSRNEGVLDRIPQLIEACPQSRVLVLTETPDSELHLRGIRLGATGVLLKQGPPATLFEAIRTVYAGEAWLNPSMIPAMAVLLRPEPASRDRDAWGRPEKPGRSPSVCSFRKKPSPIIWAPSSASSGSLTG
jgi:two-component system nitrate/nitrite response regulator NarL